MIRTLRRFFRLFRLILHTVIGLFMGLAAAVSARPEIWSQRWFRGLLNILNLQVHSSGARDVAPALVAGNHQSWLDIAVLATLKPVIFVSKAEIRQWPLIGWLSRSADTLFIARGGHGTKALNEDITAMLSTGRCVVVFPEGTTTSGPGVRRFQPRLFAGAIATGAPILPFALRYREACAPYVGDQTLVGNLWNLLAEKALHVEVHFGPPLDCGESRDAIARATQDWASSALACPPRWAPAQPTGANTEHRCEA